MASFSTPQIFVALGSVEAGLVEPVLSPHQQLIHDPTDDGSRPGRRRHCPRRLPGGPELLDRMPALKVIARTGVGTDLVDVAEANRRGIPVVITPEATRPPSPKACSAHLLALVKKLSTLTSLVREGRWEQRSDVAVG